jgi:pyocin large subunit-like protein
VAYNLILNMPSKEQAPFEVACPDCGAMLKIDPATRAVIAHTPAPRKRTFEDFETAARAMREQDERKESLFRQAVDAEKNKNDVLEKKFAEAVRKAKETPDTGKPLRDFDLD